MSKFAQSDHRSHSKAVYQAALEKARSDRVMLPDHLLTQESQVSDASRELKAVYESYSWAAHSLKARMWLQATLWFNLILMPFEYFLSASLLVPTLIIRGVIVSAILYGLYVLWGRQRPTWVQGATLLVVAATIMLEAGSLGALVGITLFERYLTAGLFTVATALLFFPIEFRWTIAAVAVAVTLHVVMLTVGPVADAFVATTVSCFYCSAIVAFASTRKAALRSQWKSFKSKIRELRDQETLTQLNAELKLVADLDPLTGILNRRSAQQHIDRIWGSGDQSRSSIAFMMLDIDDFKKLNDTFGHGVGDDCIKGVATEIGHCLRSGDIVSRYGGEEFLVALSGSTPSSALAVAERIRKSVAELELGDPVNDIECRVTISIGLALWEGDETPEMLINRADKALYLAKHQGKNQTVVARPPRQNRRPESHNSETKIEPASPRNVA